MQCTLHLLPVRAKLSRILSRCPVEDGSTVKAWKWSYLKAIWFPGQFKLIFRRNRWKNWMGLILRAWRRSCTRWCAQCTGRRWPAQTQVEFILFSLRIWDRQGTVLQYDRVRAVQMLQFPEEVASSLPLIWFTTPWAILPCVHTVYRWSQISEITGSKAEWAIVWTSE